MKSFLKKRLMLIIALISIASIYIIIISTTKTVTTSSYEIVPSQHLIHSSIINYPHLSGMQNKKKQKAINQLIDENISYLVETAMEPFHRHPEQWDKRKKSCFSVYEIKWSSDHLLSIYYSVRVQHSDVISDLHRTFNINLDTAQEVRLNDIFIINEDFIRNWRRKKMMDNKREMAIDEISDKNWEHLFKFGDQRFYFTEDILCISPYITKNFVYDTFTYYYDLKDHIKDPQDPIWEGLKVQ